MIRQPLPDLPIEEQPEPVVMRMGMWGEARGESPVGMLAFWWVARNRAIRHDLSMKMVILARKQFSCFNENNPNRVKLLTAWNDDRIGWARVDVVCLLAEGGYTTDPTHGATHYFVKTMDPRPSWALPENGWVPLVTIDHHEFGRAA